MSKNNGILIACRALDGALPNTIANNVSGAKPTRLETETKIACRALDGALPNTIANNVSGAKPTRLETETKIACRALDGALPYTVAINASGAEPTRLETETKIACRPLVGGIQSTTRNNVSGEAGNGRNTKPKHEPKTCRDCGATITERDILGLNKKMFGVNTTSYYCLECMAAEFKIDTEYLLKKIEDWKWLGCELF